MEIRPATYSDSADILQIYDAARAFMRANGNMSQWVGNYPSIETVEEDIASHSLYVCLHEGRIQGVFTFFVGKDPTYKEIYDGAWLNECEYSVMHRMASRGEIHGVASFCLDYCIAAHGNLKVDTHRDNKVMQHIFEKKGFQRCGTIYIADGSPRIAYQITKDPR